MKELNTSSWCTHRHFISGCYQYTWIICSLY